jgi:hypothetical protein
MNGKNPIPLFYFKVPCKNIEEPAYKLHDPEG